MALPLLLFQSVEQNYSFDENGNLQGPRRSSTWKRLIAFSAALAVIVGSLTWILDGFLPAASKAEIKTETDVVFAPTSPDYENLLAPPNDLDDAGALEEQVAVFDREQVLSDFDNRISDKFDVPENLRDRVGFWFDIYTKYDEHKRVIHHSRFPWIVYKVVDVTDIIFAETPRRRWQRNLKADEAVDREADKIKKAIRSVSRKSNLKKLNESEQLVVNALKKLGGNVQKNARLAMGETRVQMGQKNFFQSGLEISPRYLGTMEKIFEKHKLPVELTRLPFVESSFNKHATSKVGAAGLWQFMGNTGKKFMIVNDSIDERRSPFKATEAAARLLKENHMILKRSWPMAITAWNHGPGGIRKAAKAAGTTDLGTIVKKYRSKNFDFASSNFYCEFLAALHAEKYHDIIYTGLNKEQALDLHAVRLPRAVRVNELIRASRMNAEEFLILNPDLKAAAKVNASLPSGFHIHVPTQARLGLERHLMIASNSSRKSLKL